MQLHWGIALLALKGGGGVLPQQTCLSEFWTAPKFQALLRSPLTFTTTVVPLGGSERSEITNPSAVTTYRRAEGSRFVVVKKRLMSSESHPLDQGMALGDSERSDAPRGATVVVNSNGLP